MPIISISNLQPAGFELLDDSESYLRELSEKEFSSIQGGDIPFTLRVTAGGVIAGLFTGPICTVAYASYIATRY